jgi:hypothetical protein
MVPFARSEVALHFHCGGCILPCNQTISMELFFYFNQAPCIDPQKFYTRKKKMYGLRPGLAHYCWITFLGGMDKPFFFYYCFPLFRYFSVPIVSFHPFKKGENDCGFPVFPPNFFAVHDANLTQHRHRKFY